MSRIRKSLMMAGALIIGLPFCLTGCASLFSGSLRVEVDVYKGPLSKELDAQKAELAGLIRRVPETLHGLDVQLLRSQCRLGCVEPASDANSYTPDGSDCQKWRMPPRPPDPITATGDPNDRETPWQNGSSHEECEEAGENPCKWKYPRQYVTRYLECHEYQGLRKRVAAMRKAASDVGELCPRTLEEEQPCLKGVLTLANKFRVLATEVSFQWAATVRKDKRVRIDQAKFANTMAEFSNHLASRADSLMKQTRDVDPIPVEELPTSIFLRDASITAYANTYEWMDAATKGEDLPVGVRKRIVDRLFDDGTWARVNEVYASGTGKVSMAFVKDDIGNWNLKAFENDPTEMIEAFKSVTMAGLKAAGDLAGGGNVASALKMLSVSKAGFSGKDPLASVLPKSLTLKDQHEQLRTELKAIQKEYDAGELKSDDAIVKVKTLLDKHDYLVEALQRAIVAEAESRENE
jgi:hypothetical protein